MNLLGLLDEKGKNAGAKSDAAEPASCFLLVNRESGTVKDVWSDDYREQLLMNLEKSGWNVTFEEVEGEAIDATLDAALEAKYDAILTAGGDGTTAGVAKRMIGSKTPLGILPFGTLNLAPRSLGTPLDPLEAALRLSPKRVREIDVMLVNETVCLCVTILGVYPQILKRQASFHGQSWWRKFSQLGGDFIKTYFKTSRLRFKVTEQGGDKLQRKTRMAFIVPGEFRDELGFLPQREGLDSGRCTLLTSEHASRWALFRAFCGYVTGSSQFDPDLDIRQLGSFELTAHKKDKLLAAVDGEVVELETPVRFEIQSQALRMLDPREPHENGATAESENEKTSSQ